MKIEVELTEEQWELLCLAMGAATGWFMKEGNRELAHKTFAMSQVIITSVLDREKVEERSQ